MMLFLIGFVFGGAIGAAFIFGIKRAEVEELREICGDLCRRLEREKWENRPDYRKAP